MCALLLCLKGGECTQSIHMQYNICFFSLIAFVADIRTDSVCSILRAADSLLIAAHAFSCKSDFPFFFLYS